MGVGAQSRLGRAAGLRTFARNACRQRDGLRSVRWRIANRKLTGLRQACQITAFS